MAIVQVSRITHRKGLRENLPQLAGAEFGWVIDEEGFLSEMAPLKKVPRRSVTQKFSPNTVIS